MTNCIDSYYNQYNNQYRIYTIMNADKLASFRVDSDLWQQFQGHAKENNTNASALLVAYIKSVVNGTSNPVVNTSSEINNPTLSLQDIDKRIDEKIKQSIQNINTTSLQDIDNRIIESIQDIKPSIQNIEDLIDARIGGSIADGDIKDAIAICYAGIMGQFNGLLEELQSIPPAPVHSPQLPVTNDQLPITNYELPITDDQLSMTNDKLPITDEIDRTAQNIIELLNIGGIVQGELYNAESLEDDGIFDSISKNQDIFEALVGEKPTSKKDTADVNKILKIMGYQIERTTKDKKKYNRVKLPK